MGGGASGDGPGMVRLGPLRDWQPRIQPELGKILHEKARKSSIDVEWCQENETRDDNVEMESL